MLGEILGKILGKRFKILGKILQIFRKVIKILGNTLKILGKTLQISESVENLSKSSKSRRTFPHRRSRHRAPRHLHSFPTYFAPRSTRCLPLPWRGPILTLLNRSVLVLRAQESPIPGTLTLLSSQHREASPNWWLPNSALVEDMNLERVVPVPYWFVGMNLRKES